MIDMITRPGWKIAALAFFALAIFTVNALAQDEQKSGFTIGLKFNGGIGFLLDGGGDLEKTRQGIVDYHYDLGGMRGYTGYSDWGKKPTLAAFDGDLVFQFGKTFGIGIGSGYLWYRSQGSYGDTIAIAQAAGADTITVNASTSSIRNYKLTAIPIKLSLFAAFPMGRWNLYGRAGAGYYFGHLTSEMSSDVAMTEQLLSPTQPDVRGDITGRIEVAEDSKVNAVGFHGGLGLEYRLAPAIALGIECFGRIVDFSGWSGTRSQSTEARIRLWREGVGWYSDQTTTTTESVAGRLYYAEYRDANLNKYYGDMGIQETKPFGLDIQNSREAKINLNAVGLVFSIRFYFN
jgi:hypothetical protein